MRRVCAPPRTDSLVPTNMTSTAILRVCSGSLAATRKGRSRARHFGTTFTFLVQFIYYLFSSRPRRRVSASCEGTTLAVMRAMPQPSLSEPPLSLSEPPAPSPSLALGAA